MMTMRFMKKLISLDDLGLEQNISQGKLQKYNNQTDKDVCDTRVISSRFSQLHPPVRAKSAEAAL